MVKVKVTYQLLDGKEFIKTKELPAYGGNDFPTQFNTGDAISQSKEEPQGMFVIDKVDKETKTIFLKEINCDPEHWKYAIGKGPNEDCKTRNCPLLNNCPISAHLMLMADVD